MKALLLIFLSLLNFTACKPQSQASDPIANIWLGKWKGPEGTSLILAPTGSGYNITIQNLDGARTFPAILRGKNLTFMRDNITETIRPGIGVETGMKWLADKQNCLIIKVSEGYCRL